MESALNSSNLSLVNPRLPSDIKRVIQELMWEVCKSKTPLEEFCKRLQKILADAQADPSTGKNHVKPEHFSVHFFLKQSLLKIQYLPYTEAIRSLVSERKLVQPNMFHCLNFRFNEDMWDRLEKAKRGQDVGFFIIWLKDARHFRCKPKSYSHKEFDKFEKDIKFFTKSVRDNVLGSYNPESKFVNVRTLTEGMTVAVDFKNTGVDENGLPIVHTYTITTANISTAKYGTGLPIGHIMSKIPAKMREEHDDLEDGVYTFVHSDLGLPGLEERVIYHDQILGFDYDCLNGDVISALGQVNTKELARTLGEDRIAELNPVLAAIKEAVEGDPERLLRLPDDTRHTIVTGFEVELCVRQAGHITPVMSFRLLTPYGFAKDIFTRYHRKIGASIRRRIVSDLGIAGDVGDINLRTFMRVLKSEGGAGVVGDCLALAAGSQDSEAAKTLSGLLPDCRPILNDIFSDAFSDDLVFQQAEEETKRAPEVPRTNDVVSGRETRNNDRQDPSNGGPRGRGGHMQGGRGGYSAQTQQRQGPQASGSGRGGNNNRGGRGGYRNAATEAKAFFGFTVHAQCNNHAKTAKKEHAPAETKAESTPVYSDKITDATQKRMDLNGSPRLSVRHDQLMQELAIEVAEEDEDG